MAHLGLVRASIQAAAVKSEEALPRPVMDMCGGF